MERIEKACESQPRISLHFGQPPPPIPPAIMDLYLDVVEAQKKALVNLQVAR